MADVKDLADLESEEDESEKGSWKLHKQLVRARTSLLIFRRWVNHSFAASEVGNNGVDWEFYAGAPSPIYMIVRYGNGKLVPDIHTSTPPNRVEERPCRR